MYIEDIRNNHLYDLIRLIMDSEGEYIPDDLAIDLINELVFSTLICPAHNGNIELLQIGPNTFIPGFTSIDDFEKYGGECEAISWEVPRYHQYLDSDVDGIIINPKGIGFIIPHDLLIRVLEHFILYKKGGNLISNFTHEELNELRNIKNPAIDNLVNPYVDFDELIRELSKGTIFTLMKCLDDADNFAVDGIISMDKLQVDGLMVIKEMNLECGMLFTSFDYFEPFYSYLRDKGRIVYPHIINLKIIVEFVLQMDLDGFIINYGHRSLIIKRQDILDNIDYIFEQCNKNIKNDFTDFVYLLDQSPISKGYDVKVRLDDFKPLTWRDLIIPAGITFKDLDAILKILWNFLGYHLSRFTFQNDFTVVTNEFPDISFDGGEVNSKDVIIDEYFDFNKKIYWEYDYGDGWSFTIEVKKVIGYDKDYPTIKRFKGEYNPQDDIGGVWGLEKLIKQDSDQLTKFDLEDVQLSLENFKDNLFDF